MHSFIKASANYNMLKSVGLHDFMRLFREGSTKLTLGELGWPSRSNWNLEIFVFEERRKPEYPEKNLLEQGREPTTNSTYIRHQVRESNPGHSGGRRVLSPLRHPCSPKSSSKVDASDPPPNPGWGEKRWSYL